MDFWEISSDDDVCFDLGSEQALNRKTNDDDEGHDDDFAIGHLPSQGDMGTRQVEPYSRAVGLIEKQFGEHGSTAPVTTSPPSGLDQHAPCVASMGDGIHNRQFWQCVYGIAAGRDGHAEFHSGLMLPFFVYMGRYLRVFFSMLTQRLAGYSAHILLTYVFNFVRTYRCEP